LFLVSGLVVLPTKPADVARIPLEKSAAKAQRQGLRLAPRLCEPGEAWGSRLATEPAGRPPRRPGPSTWCPSRGSPVSRRNADI